MQFWEITLTCALTAFAIGAILGFILIPFLRKIHFGQTILDIGPAWHKSKQGTPIMGGFMFIIGSLIACIFAYGLYKKYYIGDLTEEFLNKLLKMLLCIGFALGNCAIGFADDYIKAVKKRNLGLKARHKVLLQLLFGAAFLALLYALGDTATHIDLGFVQWQFGVFYYPVMLLVILFLTNAVNLTDGIDGLCGSVTTITMLALSLICERISEPEVSLFAIAVAGGCMGFLVWNLHPAKCFMGDTGSMFLGGAFTAITLVTHNHIIMILTGIIYICEALSVVLQVISFKTTGKRIFKMSPIHHHFEMCKWSEYKIVAVFSLIAIIGSATAVLIIN